MDKTINTIIFDLGGVIINIDYQATILAFEAMGIEHFNEKFSQAIQSPFFEEFEKGLRTETDFYRYIQQIGAQDLPEDAIENAWNAMLLDIPVDRLNFLNELKSNYKIILLSNTNIIHERAFNQQLKKLWDTADFLSLFHAVYLSHQVGMRKPNQNIFEKIISDHLLNPVQTLFIDDSVQHIQTAQSLGLATIHLLPEMNLKNEIKAMLS